MTGEVGQERLVEVSHVTRSPTVAGSALAAGIMQCAAWAEAEWSIVVEPGVAALALCAALHASPVRKIAGF